MSGHLKPIHIAALLKESWYSTFHIMEINCVSISHLLILFPYESVYTKIFSEVEGNSENNGQFISSFKKYTKMDISHSTIEWSHRSIVSSERCQRKTKWTQQFLYCIKCSFCGNINEVKTSGDHRTGSRGPLASNINTRAALGSSHAGIGNTHLNNLLSTMNIPTMNHRLFKKEKGK